MAWFGALPPRLRTRCRVGRARPRAHRRRAPKCWRPGSPRPVSPTTRRVRCRAPFARPPAPRSPLRRTYLGEGPMVSLKFLGGVKHVTRELHLAVTSALRRALAIRSPWLLPETYAFRRPKYGRYRT